MTVRQKNKLTKEEERTANKVLPKAGLNGFDWTFVQGSTAVILLNFSAENPRLRQYPNRYRQPITTPLPRPDHRQ